MPTNHMSTERLIEDRRALLDALRAIENACAGISEDAGHADRFRDGWGSAHAKIGAYARAALRRVEQED